MTVWSGVQGSGNFFLLSCQWDIREVNLDINCYLLCATGFAEESMQQAILFLQAKEPTTNSVERLDMINASYDKENGRAERKDAS